ncbi:MAG: iron-sulfur cluster biosynthesis family protein [Gammaproteobacteria bacterium]
MFTVTEAALEQIREAIRKSEAQGLALRIAAKSNQDGSIEYGMGFDEANEADTRVNHGEVEIVMDPPSSELLEDATMDFVELEPGQMRFIFLNPLDPHYVPPKKNKKKP